MNDLTPEQRARALGLYRLYFLTLTGVEPDITDAADMIPSSVKAWEAVEAHVLASHACPDVESDERVRAWRAIAAHRFFTDCYSTGGTLVDAILAKLDAAHTHTCEPVWRPTTADEIQAGWEVRTRRSNGSEVVWGTAHHRDDGGDWLTEAANLLTSDSMGWTYETTAPPPEPKPDPRVALVLEWMFDPEREAAEDDVRDLLARLDALTEGGQP